MPGGRAKPNYVKKIRRYRETLDGLGLAKREARNNPQKAKPKKKAQERAAAAAGASGEGAAPAS